MRALLLITLLVVLSMLTVREFRERQRDAAAATTQAAQGDPASRTIEDFADTHVQDEAEQPPGDTIPQPGARQLVHVPGTASANNDPPDFHALGVANEHLEAYARYNLDLALANDLAAATRLDGVHYRCREAPRSIEDVERRVASQVHAYTLIAEQNPGFRIRDESEIMEQHLETYRACQFWDALFNQEMRKKLEQLANSGHAMARYIYAMWAPRISGQADAFFVHQEWSQKAMEFSLANLTEGELAGFLVFVHAYGASTSFTARDSDLSYAFLVAAVDCGLNLPQFTHQLDSAFDPENASPRPGQEEDPRPRILAMAEGLRGFCR
jgi:hypothetical protein